MPIQAQPPMRRGLLALSVALLAHGVAPYMPTPTVVATMTTLASPI